MNSIRLKLLLTALTVGLGISGCATPVAPTGGPPDKTPPALVSSIPESNSVNFSSDRISLTFSERVDRATLQRSLSFTPEIILAPELQWHGETVDLVFRGPLRDSTTYILTLDNGFKDNRGVAISRPITMAFSTGPTIDEGRINGRVADPGTGAGLQGIDVFVYDADDADDAVDALLGNPPSYRTQSDNQGTFSFANLPQNRFFVVAVEDRNRNRMIDSTEMVAVPAWGVQLPDSARQRQAGPGAGMHPTWFLDRSDLLRPSVNTLQALSSRRTEIRFSEPVRLDSLDPTRWMLADTLTAQEFSVSAVYQPPGAANRIILVSDSLREGVYFIATAGVVRDSTGNIADVVHDGYFSSSTRPDTLRIRFGGFGPASPETPGTIDLGGEMLPEIRFNRFVDPTALARIVTARDPGDGERAVEFQSTNGTSWMLEFHPKPTPGDSIRVEISGVSPPDTVYSAIYAFLDDANTGSITGTFIDSADVVVELFSVPRPGFKLESQTDSMGVFQFDGLLKGSYRIRAFADLNGDRRWMSGGLFPHQAPEPLFWHDGPVDVRKGWESGVDTLSFVFP